MSTTMSCPQCGAQVTIDETQPATTCSSCGSAVVATLSSSGDAQIAAAMQMFGNIPGMNEIMQKAMQIKHVKDLAQAGNKLEAIKAYRELTNASLEDATQVVEAMEKGQPIMMPGGAQIFSQTMTANVDPQELAEIKELIRSGQKIEAIKRLREMTNLGLKEAKDMVEAHEAGQPLIITTSTSTVTTSYPASADDFNSQIRTLLSQNKKIDAIKLYRERTNLGLKEAKDAVEAMEIGIVPQQVSSFSQPYASTQSVISDNPFDRDERNAGLTRIILLLMVIAILGLVACGALAYFLGVFKQFGL